MGKNTKKKLKRLLNDMARPSVAMETRSLINDMDHNCNTQYSIYVLRNGFNVVCRNSRVDNRGNTTESKVSIHYVATLAEIPSVLAANGASAAMGI